MMKRIPLTFLLILGATGCGKDHTVEEYQAQKQNQEQRQTEQTIKGTFNGVLLSKMDGSAMGSLSIDISGDTDIPDTSTASGARNAIAGAITLTTKNSSQLVNVSGGFYNIYTHAFQFDFSVESTQLDPSGKPRSVKFRLAGNIDPATEVMDGTLQTIDHQKYGGKFRLTKDGNSPVLEDTRLPTDRANSVLGKTFSARPMVMGKPMVVTMKMASPTERQEGEFLNLFYPVRFTTVTATLTDTKYGDEVMTTPFDDCEWDMDSKTLTGEHTDPGANGSPPYHYTLQCTESGTEKTPGWRCNWSGSVAFDFNAKALP